MARKSRWLETSNVRLPLELGSDRRETSATRVSDDLQIGIFQLKTSARTSYVGEQKPVCMPMRALS